MSEPSQAYKKGWDRIYRDISRRCQPIPPNKIHTDKKKYNRNKQKRWFRQEAEDQ